jgi:peptidoglycan DL-endopeptidase LytF
MSRRDTIIVAVLINAGLLIVLFASALKSSSDTELVVAPPPTIQEMPETAFRKDTPAVLGDEVDQALNQFSQNALTSQTQVAALPSEPSSFADDLKMIGQLPAAPQPSEQSPAAHTLLAPVAPQAKTAPDFIEIKVKKGDVLEKIARHHHSTVAEIMKANHLTTTNLRIGQSLKIPNKAIKKAETSSIANSAPSSEGGVVYYTVKKGDSPWTIAMKNHIKVEDLLKLNHMSEEQARRLKPGDQLRIQ